MVWDELKKLTKTNHEKKSKYSHLFKLAEKENIFIKYKYNEKLQNSLE